jgi:hypothetical protein
MNEEGTGLYQCFCSKFKGNFDEVPFCDKYKKDQLIGKGLA